jgi:hypothetical protein
MLMICFNKILSTVKAAYTMVTEEALKSVQFVVNDKGQRTAVLLDIRTWDMLIKWIETVTDTKIAVQALDELQQAGGRPERASWLAWDSIHEEWSGKVK